MSNVLAYPLQSQAQNIIPFKVISNDKPIRFNKDGSASKIKNNRKAGESTEVYFLSIDEISSIRKVFNNKISSANTDKRRKTAYRNYLLFELGIGLGLRISDLSYLKYSDIYDAEEYYSSKQLIGRPYYTLMPKKTSKKRKFVTIQYTEDVINLVNRYVNEFPFDDIHDYIFKSQKSNEPVEERSFWKILKDVAYDARIKKNIGTHSMRKTFGYHTWHNSTDKSKALVELQELFNHSSVVDTMRYIGIMHEDHAKLFELASSVLYSDIHA